MKIVGLTGGIGSGKTTVANMFNQLGVPIYIADVEAKQLMVTSKEIQEELIELFGSTVYLSNGDLNKKLIASVIFKDKIALNKMNHIVHPRVAQHFKLWLNEQKGHYVIKESAILFENGGYKNCDFVITVTAPKDKRLARVISRDNTTKEKVEAIINNQWLDAEKVKHANYVINNVDLHDTQKQVNTVNANILLKISKNL